MTLEREIPSTPRGADPRRWRALAVLSLAQLLIGIDLLVMLIALPTIDADLGMSESTGQWVITAYALTFGGLLLLGGRIADYSGRKRTFLIGLAGFAVASTLGGVAPSSLVLVLARGLQGVFAALLVPAALSLINVMFTDAKERARALAVYGAVTGSGVGLGMLFGGLITEYLSWRWCLLINPPLCLLIFVATIPTITESKVAGQPRYDVIGAVLGSVGIGALVYGFARAGTDGWGDTITLASIAAALAILAAFVRVETQVDQPLLPLRLVTAPARAGALLGVMFGFAGLMGIFLSLIFYLQRIKGYSAVECGLALLPYATAAVVAAAVLEQRLGRVRRHIPIVAGLSGMTLICAWFGFIDLGWSYAGHILPALVLLGMCVVTQYIGVSATILDDAPEDDSGVCSALFNVAVNLGVALGPPLLTTIAVRKTESAAGHGPPTPADIVAGYQVGSFAAAGLVAIGALLALVLIRRAR